MYGGACLHGCLQTTCMTCPWGPQEFTGSPGAGVADSCKLLCWCGDSNLTPQESALKCWVIAPASPTLLKIKHSNIIYSKYELDTYSHAKESRKTFWAFPFCIMFLEEKTLYTQQKHCNSELELQTLVWNVSWMFQEPSSISTEWCDSMHTAVWILRVQDQHCSEESCNTGQPCQKEHHTLNSESMGGGGDAAHSDTFSWCPSHCSGLAHSDMCLWHCVTITTHWVIQNGAFNHLAQHKPRGME